MVKKIRGGIVDFNRPIGIATHTLDLYHVPTKPDSIDENNNPVWDNTTFTEVGHIIHEYKYNINLSYEDKLVDFFLKSDILDEEFDCIVAVPSTSNTRHISFVAKKIAKRSNLPYLDILEKTIDVEMKKKTESERKNETNFIRCKEQQLNCNRILLIDDVVKTGTTLSECVKVLQTLNPDCKITAFCFCRT